MPSPTRIPIFDRPPSTSATPSSANPPTAAPPQSAQHQPVRTVGGQALPPGPLLSKAIGNPNNGAFLDWGQEMQARGVAGIASADKKGTPSMLGGEATGHGTLPPGYAAAYSGSGAGTSAGPTAPVAPIAPAPIVAPQGGQRPMPFASALGAAGFGPSMMRGGSKTPAAPPTAHFSSPTTAPGETPASTGSTSMQGMMAAFMSNPAIMQEFLAFMSARRPQTAPLSPPQPAKMSRRPQTAPLSPPMAKSLDETLADLDVLFKSTASVTKEEPKKKRKKRKKRKGRVVPGVRMTRPGGADRGVKMSGPAFGRGAGGTFTYGEDDEASKKIEKSEMGEYRTSPTGGLGDEYLPEYLAGFIATGFRTHAGGMAVGDDAALDALASRIVNDAVQLMGSNSNLRRAAAMIGGLTVSTVRSVLERMGASSPPIDAPSTDIDSFNAMGGSYSPRAPWMGAEHAPVVPLTISSPREDASGMIKSDDMTPLERLLMQQRAGRPALSQNEAPAVATIADDCPIHAGRDLSKARNLWNPLMPCTCAGFANAYG